MAILLITYKLNSKPSHDYAPLYDAIKKNCEKWWHYLEDVWIVSTPSTADQLAHKLYPFILKTDRLLVAKLAGQHQGWLPEDAWKWLNERQY